MGHSQKKAAGAKQIRTMRVWIDLLDAPNPLGMTSPPGGENSQLIWLRYQCVIQPETWQLILGILWK